LLKPEMKSCLSRTTSSAMFLSFIQNV
jgi:hypothetical protein